MRWLNGLLLVLVAGSLGAACSAPDSGRDARPGEDVGEVSAAITAACSTDTLGLPCDPDGPAGPKLECEGACAIAQSGLVTCAAVDTGTNDGIVCGTTTGVGDNACKRHCSGKTCLLASAPAGAACRPNAQANPCEGQCDGAGECDTIAAPCDFGRQDQLCKFDTCDFNNATQCVTRNLQRNTLCSDTDACSIGRCNAGACVPGPIVGCNDGNACTDDSCDPNDGGCVGVNDNSNSCSDGNACFTGEACNNGVCVPGVTPVNCNDNSACTTDSCDPNIGCANVPTNACDDADACTQDACAPSDGSCSHSAVTCDDSNPCTTDTCNGATGCVFTPVDCDDGDACTADSCSAGTCAHLAVSCDDADACTADSCSAGNGCEHADIAGCGSGGAGGEPGSDGGAPNPGGGAPGSDGGAPSPNGGVPGSDGGAPNPGGGVPGSDGGEPAMGGEPGTTGGSNAGTAGASGGSDTAGTGANAGTSTAGSSPTGGDAGSAGAPGHRVVEEGGCGCRVPAAPGRSSFPLVALALAGAVWARRRRRAG